MRRKVLLLSFSILLSCGLHAQKEAAHWFFGNGCGLNFFDTQTVTDSNSIPVSGVPKNESSPLNTKEGCFSLSDKDGNIIVFSDGMKVYNKDKTQIASGLSGHASSSQSGILIPYPETHGKYFIISNKQSDTNSGGLYYSIFDSSGNGTVTNINTPINQSQVEAQYLYENITSVRHANKKDYWLLNRTAGYFFAWRITKDGFPTSTTKVTPIPGTVSTINMKSEGYMKMSPDGRMVCHVNIDAPNGEVMFADFNNETGEITNILLRNWQWENSWDRRFYSLEFSPRGNNLFLSFLNTPLYVIPTNQIATGTPQLVAGASQVGTVQTGPDGRLYGIQSSGNSTKLLAIIPNPDDDIAQLKVHVFSDYLTGTGAIWGLPSFVASFFSISDIETDPELPVCRGKEITFSVNLSSSDMSQIASIEWNFGDGTIINDPNISTSISKKHTYSRRGTYILTLKPKKAGGEVITEGVKTLPVKINSCALPINHNTTLTGYYN